MLDGDEVALAEIIAAEYTGDIYRSTCNSFEFAKKLGTEFGTIASGTDFYGTKKSIPNKIEGPTGSSWHRAPWYYNSTRLTPVIPACFWPGSAPRSRWIPAKSAPE